MRWRLYQCEGVRFCTHAWFFWFVYTYFFTKLFPIVPAKSILFCIIGLDRNPQNCCINVKLNVKNARNISSSKGLREIFVIVFWKWTRIKLKTFVRFIQFVKIKIEPLLKPYMEEITKLDILAKFFMVMVLPFNRLCWLLKVYVVDTFIYRQLQITCRIDYTFQTCMKM